MARQPTVEVLVTSDDRQAAMRRDLGAGLSARRKFIPPVWFYDETGSRLFDRITRLPEYYLTRAERSILDQHAAEIVARSGAHGLVELGSGTSEKTRLLLDAMADAGALRAITLLDISEEVLRQAAADLVDRYDVDVRAVVGDFRLHLAQLSRAPNQLWAFLGSTIGNFTPAERRRLLADFGQAMGPSDHLLLGTDLVKDPARLIAAYDDAEGVTAAFNKNVLAVVNRDLDADFDPDSFDHLAVWNETERWIEMRLRSRAAQAVMVNGLDLKVMIDPGEDILTEISAKFEPRRLRSELTRCGLGLVDSCTDPAGDFLLSLISSR